eukprot:GFKZ01006240.1.p1 GENE.GFKZ01006240.1~~GFKZ01006240.1.p1  ORF type:complete len:188 (-),score=22.12 GFKZ01006240.1:7-570(-)
MYVRPMSNRGDDDVGGELTAGAMGGGKEALLQRLIGGDRHSRARGNGEMENLGNSPFFLRLAGTGMKTRVGGRNGCDEAFGGGKGGGGDGVGGLAKKVASLLDIEEVRANGRLHLGDGERAERGERGDSRSGGHSGGSDGRQGSARGSRVGARRRLSREGAGERKKERERDSTSGNKRKLCASGPRD